MMLTVFLDTNIYEVANFSFSNAGFSKLKELVNDNKVRLLYNEVIYQEVYQHINNNLKDAINEYNKILGMREFAPFKEDEKWGINARKIDENEMIKDLQQKWDSYLEECKAIKIPINNVDMDKIIEKYFKKLLPFESKKPTEFKDAIIIDSLIKYQESIGKKIFVVSADKGFRKSFRDEKGIQPYSDLNKFLNRAAEENDIEAVIIKAVRLEIDKKKDILKYVSENIMECICKENIDIEDVFSPVEILDIQDIAIKVGYIKEINDEEAVVVFENTCDITVRYVELDYNNSYFDEEQGTYLREKYQMYTSVYKTDFELLVTVKIDRDEKNIINISPTYITIDQGEMIYLGKQDLIDEKREEYESGEENMVHSQLDYGICPNCGCIISGENDGGNGFCEDCAPEFYRQPIGYQESLNFTDECILKGRI